MKKLKTLMMMMLLLTTAIISTSCSKDADEPARPSITTPSIIGTWADIETTELEYVSSTMGFSWTFTQSGTATQRIWIIVNGVTTRDDKTRFSYTYDGKNIVTTAPNGQKVTHSVSISGNKMVLGDGEGGYFYLVKQ